MSDPIKKETRPVSWPMRFSQAWIDKAKAGAAARGLGLNAYVIDCINRDIEFQVLLATHTPAAHLKTVFAPGQK